MSTLDQIKKIRERTGAGVVDVKQALTESEGDETKAVEILRKKGKDKALKKSSRVAREGVIAAYLHPNKKVGAMVKVYCETDFVARNEDFQEMAKDIAMHITAMSPLYLRPEDLPEKIMEKEREIWKEQLKNEGKPKDIISKIISGKEKKFREESALLTQPFVKNPDITVSEMIAEKVGAIGENIQLGEFTRFEM